MHSINTNLSSLPITQERNGSHSSINFTQYAARPKPREDIQYENLTALLIKEDQELNLTREETYQPFTLEINKYEETERYKRLNVSYVETKFVSIGDQERVVLQLKKPKLEPKTRLTDSVFSYSSAGRLDLSTQCVLYRVN